MIVCCSCRMCRCRISSISVFDPFCFHGVVFWVTHSESPLSQRVDPSSPWGLMDEGAEGVTHGDPKAPSHSLIKSHGNGKHYIYNS